MIPNRTVAIVGLLTVLSLVWADPAATFTPAQPPQHRLVVASHGVSAQASLYTYCRSGTYPLPGAGCGDGLPGPTAVRVPVHGGGDVAITTGVPVYSTTAVFYFPSERREIVLKVRALDASGRRFAATLPAGPPPLPLLLVGIRYRDVPSTVMGLESGSAYFSVSLVEHRHPRVRPVGVSAIARVRCERRRRCRLNPRGEVRRPAASAADCQNGSVLVRVLARGRGRMRATVPTSAGCRYRLGSRAFSLPGRVRRVLVRTSFLGSSTLTGKRAPSIGVRVPRG